MPQLTKVLLIGDSISMGYWPHAAGELAGQFAVVRNEGNAADSARLLANIESYLAAQPDAEVVHFNCGLHDIKRPRDGSGVQVGLPAYRRNLSQIVERLVAAGRKLLWATTTPVIDERHAAVKTFDRCNEDVLAYNAAAARIVAAADIPINNLYEAVVAFGLQRCLGADGVHMTDAGYAMLGRTVAAAVRRHFGEQTC